MEGKEGKPKSDSVLIAAGRDGSDLTGTVGESRVVRFGGGREISRSMLVHFL
jgi:hypothetical protein